MTEAHNRLEPLSEAPSLKELHGDFWEHFAIAIALVLLLWAVKGTEVMLGIRLAEWGLEPRTLRGLSGIVSMTFLHDDLNHLFSNSFSLLVVFFLLLHFYPRQAWRVLLWVIFLTGGLVWLFARPANHIGASGLVYGISGFLFLSGVIHEQRRFLGPTFVVALLFGGGIWWIFPIEQGISWEGHLCGLFSGCLLAILYRYRQHRQRKRDAEPEHVVDLGPQLFPPESVANPERPLPLELIPTASRPSGIWEPADRLHPRHSDIPSPRPRFKEPEALQPFFDPPVAWENPFLPTGTLPIHGEEPDQVIRYRVRSSRTVRLRYSRLPDILLD